MRRVLALALAAVLCPLAALAADEPAPVMPKELKPLTPAEVRECEAQAKRQVAELPKLVPAVKVEPPVVAPPVGLPRGAFVRHYLGRPIRLTVAESSLTFSGEVAGTQYTITCDYHVARAGVAVGVIGAADFDPPDDRPDGWAGLAEEAADAAFAFDFRVVGDSIHLRKPRTSWRGNDEMTKALVAALTGKFEPEGKSIKERLKFAEDPNARTDRLLKQSVSPRLTPAPAPR